ncbi:MAG TPA: uroporphyrinogen decarboxylase family protein [Spirochaetia bacterium]|nr:uroporphyrinogen decarboxylase family protein [Spirochaetia bacterium]
MTTREAFLATCEFQPVVPPKWEFGYWGETVDNWYNSGLPRNHYPTLERTVRTPTSGLMLPAWRTIGGHRLPRGISVMGGGLYWPTQGFPLDRDIRERFHMDASQRLVDVNLLACPMFPAEVRFEDERYWDFVDCDGVVKRFQKEPQTMPSGWEWPIRDWPSWKKYKDERLRLDNLRDRFPPDWKELVRDYRGRDYPLALGGFPYGYFGTPAHLMGYDNLFVAYFEAPDLVRDIVHTFTELWIAVFEEVLAQVDVDHYQIWEDISFGRGSMVSDDVIREFQVPYYTRMISFLKSHGVKHIFLDTDGDCRKIIPLFMDAGITGMYPFEWHCGMRVEEIRRQFPRLVMMGGIPKSEIVHGPKRIDEILAPVRETLKHGGYIPYGDHFVPPDVDWKNYCYFRERLHSIMDETPRLMRA